MTAATRRVIVAGFIAAAVLGMSCGYGPNWLANLATGLPAAAIAGTGAWTLLTAIAISIRMVAR